MATCCAATGQTDEAMRCCERAVAIGEKPGGDPAVLLRALETHAGLLRKAGKASEAEKVEARARALKESQGRRPTPEK